MSDQHRPVTITCRACGWSVHLPVQHGTADITAVEGWDVTPGGGALCDRCSTGWKPTAPATPLPTEEQPQFHAFGLVIPFVCTTSHGGGYDDGAFVAGAAFGQAWAELGQHPPRWEAYVRTPMVDQYDLMAMHYGYTMVAEPWGDHPDEWVRVVLTPTAGEPQHP